MLRQIMLGIQLAVLSWGFFATFTKAQDFDAAYGLVLSGGYSVSPQLANQWIADLHMNLVFLNVSSEIAHEVSSNSEYFSRYYVGCGYGPTIQLQYGYGDGGNSIRLRSNLCFTSQHIPLYPNGPNFTFRGGPIISLTADYFDDKTRRYGVLLGVVW